MTFFSRPTHRQRGFTLAEMLVVMFMLSLLTILTLNVTGPWLAFRAKAETEQRLQNIRTALEAAYEGSAYAVEAGATTSFGAFASSTITSNRCNNQAAAFRSISANLDTSGGNAATDAYKNDLCVFVAADSDLIDGARLHYRAVAVVSPGPDGVLEAASRLSPTTLELTLAGDDQGFVFNTKANGLRRMQVTQERMARIAKMYELHFTSRYLSNSSRDISKYYFSSWGDAGNAVGDSGANTWGAASTLLSPIGVGADLAQTAWETNNVIQVNNRSGSITVNGTNLYVRSSAPEYASSGALGLGAGFLPYTALIRAQMPAPAGQAAVYLVRAAVGGY